MKSKKYSSCVGCWWYDCCLGTVKACHKFQEIDMRWNESPNNKKNKGVKNEG